MNRAEISKGKKKKTEPGFLPAARKADEDHGWRAPGDVCHAVRALSTKTSVVSVWTPARARARHSVARPSRAHELGPAGSVGPWHE